MQNASTCRAELAPCHARLLSQLAAACADEDAKAALAHMDMAVDTARITSPDQLVSFIPSLIEILYAPHYFCTPIYFCFRNFPKSAAVF